MNLTERNQELAPRISHRIQELIQADPALQNTVAATADLQAIAAKARTSIDYIAALFEQFASRPCLGSRQGAGFVTQTYAQVWQRVQSLAGALAHQQLARPGGMMGVYGFASPDWVVGHLAAHSLCCTSVPLRTGLSQDDLRHIINETQLSCIVASAELVPRLREVLEDCPSVRGVVVMDGSSSIGLPVPSHPIAQLEAAGHSTAVVRPKPGDEPLMAILYTSGSTGRPKGAMFPESLFRRTVAGVLDSAFPPVPMITLGYLPLNHMAGLSMVYQALGKGGIVHFPQKSDMSTLFEDIRAARPTFLMLVPRVADMVYQAFTTECLRRGSASDPAVRRQVMESMRRTFLGDRLLFLMAGTAPTAPEVVTLLQDCFDVPVFNGYGATESSAISFDDRLMRNIITDVKIADVPELGYHASDKPYPRGELRIKSPLTIPGYFKNPTASAALFDEEGFYKTGDVVEQRATDHVVLIDRKHNVLKLSQGEFVSVAQLENMYTAQSPFIDQMYVYGSSSRSYLVAVIVPSLSNIEARLSKPKDAAAIKNLLRQEIDRVGRAAQVQSFEIPRDFIVHMEPFTKENGLLTESSKPARPQLKQAFGPSLEALYESVEHRGRTALKELRHRSDMTLADKVHACITATLGLDGVAGQGGDISFVRLGGDSLSAVRLVDMLREVCGVAPPVGQVLDANTTIQKLVASMEALAATAAPLLTYAAVHGADTAVARAKDISLERFLPNIETTPAVADKAQHVLLTGANGFLGRFLLLELLQHAQKCDGSVTAIVRGKDDAAASARMSEAFTRSGAVAAKQFTALQHRLKVHAGDLMLPHLGLAPKVYAGLCQSLDTVVHNGALVNHALTYPQLFEPNVLGTVEVMRLCTTRRRKALTFISTVAVTGGCDHAVSEDETGSSLWQERPIDSGYASGYATSKWAAELLCEQLAGKHDVPVNIVRSAMIMGHSSMAGQVNETDFVTRLLTSLVHAGVRPKSFYSQPGRHHFDGTPVDLEAAGIAALALHERRGLQIFHAVNSYDDGISLDTFADAISSSGYPLRTVEAYDVWFKEFSNALEKLDNAVRSTTLYPILYQWQAPTDGEAQPALRNERFAACVSRYTPFKELPHLSEGFMRTTLQHMRVRGLIPGPRGQQKRQASA